MSVFDSATGHSTFGMTDKENSPHGLKSDKSKKEHSYFREKEEQKVQSNSSY
jgi:hypothetical protein